MTAPAEACIRCDGEGWVCERHPLLPWRTLADKKGCQCSPGVPCPRCNPCDSDNPPRFPPGRQPSEGENDE